MFKFSSKLIKTDVTSLKIHENYILCGIGGQIQIFDLDSRRYLCKFKIFEGVRIYGIRTNADKILLHGQNCIKIFQADWEKLCFDEIVLYEADDWILTAKWIDGDHVITISMHNIVECFDSNFKKLERVICEELCILYCAHVSYDRASDVVVFSGTVFSEVLIWKPLSLTRDKVLKRLKGHGGVLFSIDHNDSYIASTSDDRTLILWKSHSNLNEELKKPEIKIDLLHKMCGHTARAFGCKLLTEKAISIGEDGIVNIWSLEGKFCRKIEAHQGGSIWALECCEERNIIVTGGGDSGVTVFPIVPRIWKDRLSLGEKHVPKRLVLLEDNSFVVVTETGAVFKDCIWKAQHDELRNYALLEISNRRKKIALGGFRGHIFIYELINKELNLACSYQIRLGTRIFSLHWISCDLLLTCGPDGWLFLWKHDKNELLLLHTMELPRSKEPWPMAACICPAGLVIGDRKGNIHLYNLINEDVKPSQTIKKAHNYQGVSNLYYRNNILISLGKNSRIGKYKIVKKSLIPTSQDKLPYTWLGSLIQNEDTSVLLAFSGNELILWDCYTRRALYVDQCGGGHRSWSFNQNRSDCSYAYIKDKSIHLIKTDWKSLYPYDLIPGLNSSEINSMRCIKSDKDLLLISGGEDTTLRLSKYDFKRFETMEIFKTHLSSIRCLHLLKISSEKYLIFSAGGRAQIILWEYYNSTINELHSYYEPVNEDESEIRVMDMATIVTNEIYLITACSDGNVKFYKVTNSKLTYVSTIGYELKCILKIAVVNNILLTMATNGFVQFWNLNNFVCQTKPFFSIKVQQSGINSYSIKYLENDNYALLTGGDDNALSLNIFKLVDGSIKLLNSYSNCATHCAQITGVYINDKYFMSASLDHKLAVFEYLVDSDWNISTKFKGFYDTTISDIKGIEVFETNKQFLVVLYGLGLEILTVDQ